MLSCLWSPEWFILCHMYAFIPSGRRPERCKHHRNETGFLINDCVKRIMYTLWSPQLESDLNILLQFPFSGAEQPRSSLKSAFSFLSRVSTWKPRPHLKQSVWIWEVGSEEGGRMCSVQQALTDSPGPRLGQEGSLVRCPSPVCSTRKKGRAVPLRSEGAWWETERKH